MAARSIQSELEGGGEGEGKGKGRKYVAEEDEVAIFDYCIENFFSDMDSICKLCSSSSQHDLDSADIDRFSSMITFLKYFLIVMIYLFIFLVCLLLLSQHYFFLRAWFS